jgi:phosphoribosylaminoimidazolecarboxamide formyltransferase/IMP cyclohydrolase
VNVRRALISVYDKAGVVDFARGLADLGVQIVSTGGTARLLKENDVPVTLVEEVTGFPEMLDGRVKTMHPRLMGGILAKRDVPEHMETIAAHDIEPVDLVCVSLYPFEQVSNRRGVEEEDVIENIDIGGPSMIRAAAKNHAGVAVVTSREQYGPILDELRDSGELSYETLRALAAQAFQTTAHYDITIANWFAEAEEGLPANYLAHYVKIADLSYGENPHQRAAYYTESGRRHHLLSRVEQLHGKKLSFNNLYDLHAARSLCKEFSLPCVVMIKHNNPCGCALGDTLAHAYDKALACDTGSAYGSIIAVNRSVDADTAERLSKLFVEVVLAPGYDEKALEILKRKQDIRILLNNERRQLNPGEYDGKHVTGGILVQDKDDDVEERDGMTVKTGKHPTEKEWGDLLFAYAIVFAKDLATVGVGAGQMSRLDSTRIAILKAEANLGGEALQGSVVGSDAFYPFPDAVDGAIDAGATAFIQPGGSKGDEAAVEACQRRGAAMVFTGRRHFHH